MNKKQFSILLVLILFFSCSKSDIEKIRDKCLPFQFSDTYIYPIRPGSDEWKELSSLNEKVEVCQIPDSVLNSISTEGLLETLLNYPLITDYSFFNRMQSGFNRFKNENIGFTELYTKNDIFNVIVNRYELMSLNCKGKIYPPFNNGNVENPIEIPFTTFELFIFQDELLSNINSIKREIIFEHVYNKYLLKIELGFFAYSKLVAIAILGKIMYQNGFTPFVNYCEETEFIKFFIESIPGYRPEDLFIEDIIAEYAKEYYETLL